LRQGSAGFDGARGVEPPVLDGAEGGSDSQRIGSVLWWLV